jgi:proline dehydrogenase
MPEKVVWMFSGKYIAGKDITDVIRVTRDFNTQGISTTIDLLGEYLTSGDKIAVHRKEYLNLIKTTAEEGLSNSFSLKPSMFGLLIDEEMCYQNVREIVVEAASMGRFVRIDMEDSSCTGKEIELYSRLYPEFPDNVGIVLQSYLKRTLSDIEKLSGLKPEGKVNIRICKGIYNESGEIAYKNMKEINANYLAALDLMFKHGIQAAIATHDKKLIDGAIGLIEKYKFSGSDFEFQMLYGVTPDLRTSLVKKGYKMRVYVPYGRDWLNYSTRRLKENPRLVAHIIKALFTHK